VVRVTLLPLFTGNNDASANSNNIVPLAFVIDNPELAVHSDKHSLFSLLVCHSCKKRVDSQEAQLETRDKPLRDLWIGSYRWLREAMN
jgi:hypothetical protein